MEVSLQAFLTSALDGVGHLNTQDAELVKKEPLGPNEYNVAWDTYVYILTSRSLVTYWVIHN
jgi:hypothetical protein